jgi:hypothetical protein
VINIIRRKTGSLQFLCAKSTGKLADNGCDKLKVGEFIGS